ncbi:MAG: galactose-1-phosphate uridylyltransferase [bacterium]
MSELRQNIALREWVIIADERAKRPYDYIQKKGNENILKEYVDNCPFCPGNEHLAPPEISSIRDSDGNWLVRSIPNKFPALSSEGDLVHEAEGIKRRMTGVGFHEVIIETPKHNLNLALLDDLQVINIIRIYKERYLDIVKDKRIELIILFKNHGRSAGTSLEHPHSQLIATPVVPQDIRNRIEESMRYYDDHRRCVFCDMLEEEIRAKERIVLETSSFVAFIPYAAFSPFHIWILPKKHMSSFPQLTDRDMEDFSKNLRIVLKKLYIGLNDPDFNYVIRSIPGMPRERPFFHWYLSIIPRVTLTAGFELGSGMFINTSIPEESAEFLRNVEID